MINESLTPEERKPLVDVEIAGITEGRDITRGYMLPLLTPQDRTLVEQGGFNVEYLQTYSKILEDPQVSACYQQRFGKLTSCPIEVIPASQSAIDRKAADWWRNQMPIAATADNAAEINVNKLPMDNLTTKMLMGLHYGFSFAEKMLTRSPDGMTNLDIKRGSIRVRNRSRIRFDKDFKPRLITLANSYEGEPIHDSRAWVMTFGGDNDDDPYGKGLAPILYWLTVFKRGDMRHWLNFLDSFAQPSGRVEYDPNSNQEDKDAALMLATAIGQGQSVAHASGLIAELMETTRGTADFAGLYDRCNTEIAKVILSQASTTDNQAWSGTSQVHQNVADDIVASDGDFFSQSFYKNVSVPITFYNYPEANAPYIRYRTEGDEDINARATRDKQLFDFGIKLTPELVAKTYGEGYIYEQAQTLLNPAQLTSLTAMITTASAGQMPPDSLEAIMINTMGITPEAAAQIVAPIRNNPQPQLLAPPAPKPSPQVIGEVKPVDDAPSPQFTELRSGEIYDFVDKPKNDTVEQIADNLANPLAEHLQTWQSRLELAYAESSSADEFQERSIAIFEGMAKSREKLAAEAAKAFRIANLAGILEAEEDAE